MLCSPWCPGTWSAPLDALLVSCIWEARTCQECVHAPANGMHSYNRHALLDASSSVAKCMLLSMCPLGAFLGALSQARTFGALLLADCSFISSFKTLSNFS